MLKKIVNKIRSVINNRINNKKLINIVRTAEEPSNMPRFFMLQTPVHTNIGDHAIAEAQLTFLSDNFPNRVIEINQSLVEKFVIKHSGCVRPEDVILLHGGGNMGNEYLFEEELRRLVISGFKKNKIIVFPQTAYYSNDSIGQQELSKTKAVIDEHPDVTLTARENISYEIMKSNFSNSKVILTPDIVLYTSFNADNVRSYGLEVIRNDQESVLNDSDKKKIHDLLNKTYETVLCSDMHVTNKKRIYDPSERKDVLESKLTQFSKARLVITDRLHGMVLATITGTPCIVFSNYNQKVLGTYKWINNLKYIKYVNDINELDEAYQSLASIGCFEKYNPNDLKERYRPLIDSINA